VQEKKPSPGGDSSIPPPPAEGRKVVWGSRQPTWLWAAILWAVAFLFLSTLMLFDLVIGFFHR
jgi:hypothetical protein